MTAGKSAFAFTTSAFVPTDRVQTGRLRTIGTGGNWSGVKLAKNLSANTTIHDPTPPAVGQPTSTFSRQGTFPDHTSAFNVTWTLPSQTSLIDNQDIYVQIGSNSWQLLAANIGAATTSYLHTGIAADTTYKYYIVTKNLVAGRVTDGTANTNNSLGSPGIVNAITNSAAWNSITWTWTYPANTYQRFHIYNIAGTYLGEVLPALSSTSSTWTYADRAENTAYSGLRVYGQNINGHWSANRDAANVTTPYRCDCTGIINGATWSQVVGCGTCGSKTQYKRSVCGETVCDGACTENACGCIGNGTNGWTYTANGGGSESAGCDTCGIKYRYKDKYSKPGCNDYITDWGPYSACLDDPGDCTTFGVHPCNSAYFVDVTESEFSTWNRTPFMGLLWSYGNLEWWYGTEGLWKGLFYYASNETYYEHFSECCTTAYGCNTNCGRSCCYCYPKMYRAYRCTRTGKLSIVFAKCIFGCFYGC